MKEERVMVTATLDNDMKEDDVFCKEVLEAFERFKKGDWGNISENDAMMNNEAAETGEGRIVAKYETSKAPIYIINAEEPIDTDVSGEIIVKRMTTLLYTNEY